MKKTTTRPRSLSGFTLLELSIVIVIIGLIVAGISAGQSLVKSANIRAQIADLKNFEVAFNTFQLQYDAIPGDMIDADDYWGAATAGNGNGRIDSVSDTATPADTDEERYAFFEHLSYAGLLDQNYTNTYALGVGYPRLKIDSNKGMWAVGSQGHSFPAFLQISASENTRQYSVVLAMHVARPSETGGEYNDDVGTMDGMEVSAIDVKMDDGIPRQGKFKGYNAFSVSTVCLTGIDGDYAYTEEYLCNGEYILKY